MARVRVTPRGESNVYIRALTGDTSWTPGDIITFYLDDSGGSWSTAAAGAAFANAARAWSAVADITFQATTSRSGATLIETLYRDPGDEFLGYHELPHSSQVHGHYNAAQPVFTAANNRLGGYSYVTFLHEIGHALGLKHPFEGDPIFPGAVDDAADGDHGFSRLEHTVMAYEGGKSYQDPSTGWPVTPMAFDIAAIQALYGANMATATGNNTYALFPASGEGSRFTCIWDAGGGRDAISAADASYACVIDLRAATLKAEPGGGGFFSYIQGGYEATSGISIAHGVTIERAIGSDFNDIITGNDGRNIIIGGGGVDNLTGGGGRDTFVVTPDDIGSADSINDFESGKDRFDVSAFAATHYTVYNGNPGSYDVVFHSKLGDAEYAVTGAYAAADFGGLAAQLNVVLTDAAESLSGGAYADTIIGLGGRDTLIANGGDDWLEGGDLADSLGGGSGNDWLVGGLGADTMSGGSGNDSLFGGDPGDVLNGGSGDDRYRTDGAVIETRNGGHDTVNAYVDYVLGAYVEDLDLGNWNARVTNYDQTGTGNRLGNRITGNPGRNIISGLAGADTLSGAENDDVLDGGEGADRLVGGKGNDTYIINDAFDEVVEAFAWPGIKPNRPFLYEGRQDEVRASISYTLPDHVEHLTLVASTGLVGRGNGDGNRITGSVGTDTLAGGGGADTLIGGGGRDMLGGGDGADRFVFDDDGFGGATRALADRISGFSHAQKDRIDLKAVDAVEGRTDSTFVFIGTAAFSKQAGELRFFKHGKNTFVGGDLDGDGAADFLIRLDGHHGLVASDFVL